MSNDLTPPDGQAWDLLVLGGGTAGIVGGKTAAGLGASVLLVERDRTGGDCLWTGCVPSKSLLAAAHAAADARAASRLGVEVGEVRVDFAAVMAHVRASIAAIAPVDSPDALRRAGVRVASGQVTLTGPDTAAVDGTPVRFRQALVATGAEPALPAIPGLVGARPLTSETIWQLDALPGALLVLGGGSIGCELGQAFARLGSRVTVVEAGPRLLPREDADAAGLVHSALTVDGVDVRVDATVTAVTATTAVLADGTVLDFDVLLVATGRLPRTAGLGLDAAGVEVDRGAYVIVDERLATSNPRIRAAGDVTAHPPFTHTAGVHASTAASNAVLGLRRSVTLAAIPRVTFTDPEVAAVGVGAEAAKVAKRRVFEIGHDDVDRAVAEGRTAGFARIVVDRKGRVVGATIVGPRAGECLAEATLAVRQGLRARDLAGSMHAYPTYADGVWNAALAALRADLGRRPVRLVTRVLARWRRRRLS